MIPALVATAVALLAAGPPQSNETVLTARQSQRLVDYAVAMQSCLARGGLHVARPDVTRKQIELAVSGAASTREVLQAGLACGRRIGDPPTYASLQGFRDRVVLYVPKQCLIDKDVAARN